MKAKQYVIALVIAALLITGFFLLKPEELIFRLTGPIAQGLFLLVIITEVVIAPVPGGIISLLGAAHFGFWKAWPILYAGNLVGSSIAFWLAKRYGRPIINKMTKEHERQKYDRIVHGRRGLLWLVYSVPVFPIDVISFLCGFSTLRFKQWFPIMATGMLAYTVIMAAVGAFFGQFIPYLGYISTLVLIVFLVLVVIVLFRMKK